MHIWWLCRVNEDTSHTVYTAAGDLLHIHGLAMLLIIRLPSLRPADVAVIGPALDRPVMQDAAGERSGTTDHVAVYRVVIIECLLNLGSM